MIPRATALVVCVAAILLFVAAVQSKSSPQLAQAKPAQVNAQLERCKSNRLGVVWYRFATWKWQEKRQGRLADTAPTVHGKSCRRAHYAVQEWRARSIAARTKYRKWFRYNYAWWDWLPSNWQALGACETGYGQRPGNFEHNNAKFVSAFGISWAEYNSDAAYFGSPPWHVRHTPRDQYNAALGHYARFGDGWSCPGP